MLRNPSSGFRAGCWNTYVASCIPFPAHMCIAPMEAWRRMQGIYARTMALRGWCPGPILPGITILWGIRGGPRYPCSVMCAATAIAWVRAGGWGSDAMKCAQPTCWRRLQNLCDEVQRERSANLHGRDADVEALVGLARSDFGHSRAGDDGCRPMALHGPLYGQLRTLLRHFMHFASLMGLYVAYKVTVPDW